MMSMRFSSFRCKWDGEWSQCTENDDDDGPDSLGGGGEGGEGEGWDEGGDTEEGTRRAKSAKAHVLRVRRRLS